MWPVGNIERTLLGICKPQPNSNYLAMIGLGDDFLDQDLASNLNTCVYDISL
ncbi:MAG: hypothetical protein CFH41_01009 [Alphaproteobacteria bacterium MarineAlpha11_Bin1]|nr:MAG: hypothetical protein CFH41_01009 [Alphaproteobacteria bacterium MarineAlpha11_Bin1]